MDWQPSPGPGVWRKRLALAGGAESGRVTSLVRFDAASRFPPHRHPDGEEILVLEGVFSDETGDYPAGFYLLNPDATGHAPFSRPGCVLFVKLRQYGGAGRRRVAIDAAALEWRETAAPGVFEKPLYAQPPFPERTALVRLAAGARLAPHDHPHGEEILVLDGVLEDEFGRYPAGTWVRDPPGSAHAPHSPGGCTLYLGTGGLGGPTVRNR